jgi:hypothetical protein
MNWDAIAAVGQAVSALALVFVILQLRLARDEMRRATRQARRYGTQDLWVTQATHPDLDRRGHTTPLRSTCQTTLGLSPPAARRLYAMAWAGWHDSAAAVESVEHLSPGGREELHNTLPTNYARTPRKVGRVASSRSWS